MASPLPHYLEAFGDGVYAVDTGFPRDRADAAYLVVHEGRAAFVDTGTNHALPRLLGALDALGLARDAVDYVIPTHVHLDHAGGVGALMRELPGALALVHPRGERHLADPTALWHGAMEVYGEDAMERAYGRLVPVPAERMRATVDGEEVSLAGRALTIAHTPGHARHHHCVWDPVTRGWFTGDTFGLSYREYDCANGSWIVPTSAPAQFDPGPHAESIRRMLDARPRCMYVTHYGRVGDAAAAGERLLDGLARMVALGRSVPDGPGRHEALKRGLLEIFAQALEALGWRFTREEVAAQLALDIELNAQGMAPWIDRERAAAAGAGAAPAGAGASQARRDGAAS